MGHATVKFHNRLEAMAELFPVEGIYVLTGSNDIEAISTNENLYFQKLWIYPAKAVANGVLTANGAAVYVGKSGNHAAVTVTKVDFAGAVATVTAPAHNFSEGMSVAIAGATPAAFNGTFQIYECTTNTFKYRLPAGQPSGPVTVLPTAARVQYLPDVLNPGDAPLKYEVPLGGKLRLMDVLVTGTAGDGVFYSFE